jgi:hypothetical protein
VDPVNVNTLFDEPLAGCLDIVQDPGNFMTFRNSLELRLSLVTSRLEAETILGRIHDDYNFPDDDPFTVGLPEYVINELQYEIRKRRSNYNEETENPILSKWFDHLVDHYNMTSDEAIGFMAAVTKARAKRRFGHIS